ncbi:thiolase family protein [Gordonia sp. (in: high G+C Gram-positive bacteria)]|uniref:thiolase family protein n=1 Tax=Gordonia sp. (in: high G+C Gram-positive bacteria) TaxID=84139 RepID=UPI003F96A517
MTAAAIAGLGMTEMGKVYGRTAIDFGADAVRLAAADAGLELDEIDALLISSGVTGELGLPLAVALDMQDLRVLSEVQAFGSTAGLMIQMATRAIDAGDADVVACVFADAPLRERRSVGDAYAQANSAVSGWEGILRVNGVNSANALYALAVQRHIDTFGTTSEQLGSIAVAQRQWAQCNPVAQMRDPISLDDHQASRLIAGPLHLLDCCLVSNGGVAVILTSEERAADLRRPAVSVLGAAQAHPGRYMRRRDDFGLVTGAAQAGPRALAQAGVSIDDIDLVELYDCYTYTVLVTLEDYGFCEKGEGGQFVSETGMLGPCGTLALNTGGGQLSSYYMWGFTPLAEAIIQLRGDAGARQVSAHDLALVSGNGGVLDHHSTLVLGANSGLVVAE